MLLNNESVGSLLLLLAILIQLVNHGSSMGPLNGPGCGVMTSGVIPHPSYCNKYIQCRGGLPWLVRPCPAGTLFDEYLMSCNHAEEVNCNKRSAFSGDFFSTYYSDDSPIEYYSTAESIADIPVITPVSTPEATPDATPIATPVSAAVSFPISRYIYGPPAYSYEEVSSLDKTIENIQNMLSRMLPSMRRSADDHFYKLRQVASQIRVHKRPFRFVQSLLGNTMQGMKISLPAYLQLHCLKALQERLQLTKAEMEDFMRRTKQVPGLIKWNSRKVGPDEGLFTPEDDMCPFPQAHEHRCDWHANFRTFDGSCNNLRYPLKGRSMRAFRRVLPPDYGDGISAPRLGLGGHELPSARRVSGDVHMDIKSLSAVITSMHMTFGQFLDHDFGRTAVTKLMNDKDEMVNVECGTSGCDTAGAENEACLPIMLPPADEAWTVRPCLMFVRSQAVLNDDCRIGPREQLNQITAYIDASVVYGSSWNETLKLRDLLRTDRGRLRVTPHPDPRLRPLLPQMSNRDCRDNNTRIQCFTAGDTRVNEQVALMAIHTLFHRYHNHLEERLHKINPHWRGERLYQETRKILIGVWQHIIYNEYLPPTLGPREMRRYGLNLQRAGYWKGYDPSVSPDTINSMQTAAFRFGHSQVTGSFRLTDYTYTQHKDITFSEVFNRPYEIYNTETPGGSGVDAIMFGQISQQAESPDQFFSEQVSKRLFSEKPPLVPGTDLPALNIQRGRDHGLPGYIKWREWCDLSVPRSFAELEDMPQEAVLRLQTIYRHVEDIDLFAGGMCEHRLRTAMLGPTFACIIGRQFHDFRVGDRFWYEREDKLVGFTPEQLAEIRKVTMARVMCNTMDHVESIQKFVMLQPLNEAINIYGANDAYLLQSLYRGDDNKRRPCSELPDLDISFWDENVSDFWWDDYDYPDDNPVPDEKVHSSYSDFDWSFPIRTLLHRRFLK